MVDPCRPFFIINVKNTLINNKNKDITYVEINFRFIRFQKFWCLYR